MKKQERDHKSTTSADRHYLSSKEIKEIARANAKVMKELEKKKYRHAEESEFVTEMKDPANILEIEDLHTYFYTEQGVVKAVNGVSYNVPKHSVVGVVGESGCGKSVTSMSVMRLIQGPTGQIASGSIRFQSSDYKRDAKGNPVKDENGAIVDFETVVKHGVNSIQEKAEKYYKISQVCSYTFKENIPHARFWI